MAYRFDKKQKLMAFGVCPDVSLTYARKQREEAKVLPVKGVDPGQAKKAEKRAAALNSSRMFEAIGQEWFTLKIPGWVPSYSGRLLSRLAADVFPALGPSRILNISSGPLKGCGPMCAT